MKNTFRYSQDIKQVLSICIFCYNCIVYNRGKRSHILVSSSNKPLVLLRTPLCINIFLSTFIAMITFCSCAFTFITTKPGIIYIKNLRKTFSFIVHRNSKCVSAFFLFQVYFVIILMFLFLKAKKKCYPEADFGGIFFFKILFSIMEYTIL